MNRCFSLYEFIPDGEETLLSLHFAPDHFGDQVQFLYPLDLDTGTPLD